MNGREKAASWSAAIHAPGLLMLEWLLVPTPPAQAPGLSGEDLFAVLFGCGFFCVFPLFALVSLGFWIWMLVDVVTREFPGDEKVIWVLVLCLVGPIGALIYFFVGRSRGVKMPLRPPMA